MLRTVLGLFVLSACQSDPSSVDGTQEPDATRPEDAGRQILLPDMEPTLVDGPVAVLPFLDAELETDAAAPDAAHAPDIGPVPDAGPVPCPPGPWPWWADTDGDGYGDRAAQVDACVQPVGHVDNARDCDDTDPRRSPEISEVPGDGVDNDCDGVAAESPPVVVRAGAECNGGLSTYEAQSNAPAVLRVLAVYEADPTGIVSVEVQASQPFWLAVSAFEAVTWQISEASPGVVLGVVVLGNPEQVVVAPSPAVPVRREAPPNDHFAWWRWDDIGTRELVGEAEREAGVPFASYAGCYTSTSFTISDGPLYPPNPGYPTCAHGAGRGPEGAGRLDALPAACAALPAEEAVCLTLSIDFEDEGRSSVLRGIGMQTGRACIATRLNTPTRPTPTAAWLGEYFHYCDPNGDVSGLLTRVHVTTGRVEKAYVPCSGVTAYDGRLLVKRYPSSMEELEIYDDLILYEDFWSAQCGVPSANLGNLTDEVFTASDGRLYSAWHSTDRISAFELPSMEALEPVVLEDYSAWVHGLAALGKREVVVSNELDLPGIYGFNLATGYRTRTLPFGILAGAALACSIVEP